MGNFRIVIDGVGGHGCEREKGSGERIFGCQRMDCPDCNARAFVADLMRRSVLSGDVTAKFVHWPGTVGEVVDDLLPFNAESDVARVRLGSFGDPKREPTYTPQPCGPNVCYSPGKPHRHGGSACTGDEPTKP